METQLNQYDTRYRASKKINALDVVQLADLLDAINKAIDSMRVGQEVDASYLVRKIRPAYKASEALAGVNLGIAEIGYMATADDRIKWINCQCGGVGKFRKVEA